MELGIIGLGKMGANIALNGMEKGIKIVGKARKQKPELTQKGVLVVEDLFVFSSTRETISFHMYSE